MRFRVTVRNLNVTDRQTDGRTDRQTDRRTDGRTDRRTGGVAISPGPTARRETTNLFTSYHNHRLDITEGNQLD